MTSLQLANCSRSCRGDGERSVADSGQSCRWNIHYCLICLIITDPIWQVTLGSSQMEYREQLYRLQWRI